VLWHRAYDPDFEKLVQNFEQDYLALSISVTPKVHAVINHVPDFCKLKQQGLGPWGEQSSEAVHHDFNKEWERNKVNCLSHPEYGKRLYKSVTTHVQ